MAGPQQNWPGPPGTTTPSGIPPSTMSSFPGAPGAGVHLNPGPAAAGRPGSAQALRPPASMPPNVQGHPTGQPFVPPGMTVRPGAMPGQGAMPGHGAPYGMPPHGMWRPQAQPASGAAPAAAPQRPAAHPQQQAVQFKCEWTEHTAPDGRKYYYNAGTKASVWQKPKAYADAEFEAEAAKVIADCPWKEHTAPDGRSYFHNRGLGRSVWKVPNELAAAQAEATRLRGQITAATAASSATTPAAVGVRSGEFMYATPEEAKTAFKAMLSHVKAPLDSKWDKITARIEAAGDARFKALKTNGQRASCYKEWLHDQRAAAVKAEADAAEQKRSAFVEMLDSKAALLEGARYSKVEALFFEDKRFEALPDANRQAAFSEWQENRRRKAEDDERAALNAKMQRFQEILDERQENKDTALTAAAVWNQVEPVVEKEEAFRECPAPGRLRVWLKMLARLVVEQKQQWEEEDADRFRSERKNRDNFRALLKKHREQGVLKARTKWRKYRDIIRKEPEYLCMETNLSGSRPRELFADVVADLNDRFNQDAVKVKAALRAAEFTVLRDTDWTDFLAALDPPEMQERLKGVLDVNIRLCYEEMWAKENAKRNTSDQRRALKHELARKMKKAADFVRPDMEWPEAQKLMLVNGFSILNDMDPRDCEHVWQEWVQRQKDKEKDRKHKREKRDRDRDRHRSDRRDADGERPADSDRDHRRSEGDKDTPDGAVGDGERASKRARHSGSPAVGGAGRERDREDKEGVDREQGRDEGEQDSQMEVEAGDDKKLVSARAASGGDVEEGEL